MREPYLSDEPLLEDIRAAASEPSRVHLWWLGQSGFLIQYRGRHLLLDPYLSDSLTRKYAATDKPHVRMTRRPIAPGQLDFIDAVTSSHNHTDHLDAETLQPLMEVNRSLRVIVPRANRALAAQRLEVPAERLETIDAGEQLDCAPFHLHAIPAAHETLERDSAGQYHFLGLVVRCGDFTLYHSGDTIRYDDQLEWLAPYSIDLMLLPINGRSPERRVAGNLWGREAAQLARDAGAGLVIPCHYEMFTFNTATTDEFAAACDEMAQPCHIVRCGERWSSRPAG